MHKLTKTVAFLGLLAPLGAAALGVGDIRLHSALNESLDAEIPLVLSGADSLSDVKVTLASPEAFAKAGLERHYFLTKLQFSPVQTANGSYAIKVSSREVMREPFLNFLVEVNWPQGKMVREFTTLLDPPSQMAGEAVADTEPAVVERPVRRYERVAEISRAGDMAPSVRRSAQRPVSTVPRQTAAPAAPLTPPSEDQLTDETYGPVRRDESLWGIAKSLNNDPSLTHEQMVMGLYRANPQAFAKGMNSLRAGSTLRLPSREFIAQLSPQQARVEFARQQGWDTSRLSAMRGPELAEAEAPQTQLRLLAPSEDKETPGGRGTGGGKAKGDLALEVAETAKQENEEFRSRLSQLEKKLAEMERLLTLKDAQIAALQSESRTVDSSSRTPPEVKAPTPVPPVTPPEVKPPGPVPPAIPPEVKTAVPETPVTPPEVKAPTPLPPRTSPEVKAPTLPKSPPVTETKAPPAVPPSAAVAEESEWPIDPIYISVAGGALVLGVGALLIRRRRNAMIAETESILLAAERASRQASDQFSTMRPVEPSVEPIASPKSSFLSEFTPSDFDTLGTEADEVDPISEADVYLAYGRYKQAEELIKHAISQHPDRDECKLKLLEIYHTTENRAAFESYAKELKAQRKDSQPDFWNKVVEMGREIAPGSPIFQAAPPSAPKSKSSEKSLNTDLGLGTLDLSDDLIDDLKRFEFEFTEPLSSSDGDTDLIALDFGLDESDVTSPPPRKSQAATDPLAGLDFDLASLGLGKSKPSAAPEKAPASSEPAGLDTPAPSHKAQAAPDPLGDLDFDFASLGLGKSTPPAAPEKAPASDEPSELDNLIPFDFGVKTPKPSNEPEDAYEEQADKSIDDILRDLTDSLRQETPPSKPEPSPAPATDMGLGSLAFDLDLFEPSVSLKTEAEPEPESAFQFQEPELVFQSESDKDDSGDLYATLTDMDQFETKLDLAKAYADMEDEESAGEILREIVTYGNEKQKAEARQLLAKMGKADAA